MHHLTTVINSFLIGIGIGAEYPCGSVSASEQTEEDGIAKNAQHRWLALATSMYFPVPSSCSIFKQSLRYNDRRWFCSWRLRASSFVLDVGCILLHSEGNPTYVNSFGDNHLRAVWRLSLGLGVVPAIAVFLWRLRMTEPPSYKKHSMKSVRIPYYLVIKRYWRGLFGISLAW